MEEQRRRRSFREHIYRIVENEQQTTWASQIFDSTIMVLIVLSVFSIVLESYANLRENYQFQFDMFEHITLGVFTLEYLMRLYTADFKYPDETSRTAASWRFAQSGSGLVDFLAIAPLFLPYFFDMDLRFVRILKMTRLLRVLKLSSLTRSIVLVGDVFVEKRFELGITLFATMITILVFSTLMYHIEHEAQPELFPNIVSTFWWAVITLTTVGYGDVYPVTSLGKLMGGIIALLGIGLVALPTGIISSAFINKIEDQEKAREAEREGSVPDSADEELENLRKTSMPSGEQHKSTHFEASHILDPKRLEENPHLACASQFQGSFVFCPFCGRKIDEIAKGAEPDETEGKKPPA